MRICLCRTIVSQRSKHSLVSRSSISSGVVVGLVHSGIAVLLWNHWFDNLGEMLAVKPLNAIYISLGMFLLGFVPAVFYVGQEVISPAIIVGGLLVLSGVGSWVAGSVVAPRSAPTPFGLYVLSWVGIVALGVIAGRLESRRNRRATG